MMHTEAFWKRTLEIFRSQPVKLLLGDGSILLGEITHVGDASCKVATSTGPLTVDLNDIRGCEPAVTRL